MADPLSKALRPASFRGVPFEVEGGDVEAGRRTQLHEYPQRDKPYVEDLGRATRAFSITAFVVGVDYIDKANRLLAALEEAGPGTLVHPWLGSMQVTLKDPARIQFDRGLGVARISCSFVEAGELVFPSAGNSTQTQSRLAAGGLEDASLVAFEDGYSVDGQPDFVADAAGADLDASFGQLEDATGLTGLDVAGYAGSASTVLGRAKGLVANPALLGGAVMDYLRLTGIAGSPQRWSDITRSLLRLAAGLYTPSAGSYATPARLVAANNTAALQGLMRQGLIAQAVGASSLVGSSLDSSTNSAYDDQLAIRDDLVDAIDAETLRTGDDAVYAALMEARSKVWQDMTLRSRDCARLTSLTPPDTVPALVLAYDLYEDADRDAEIVTRNRLRHPGFVPAQPLKVLTR